MKCKCYQPQLSSIFGVHILNCARDPIVITRFTEFGVAKILISYEQVIEIT